MNVTEATNHPSWAHPCVMITYQEVGVVLVEDLHQGATPMQQVLRRGETLEEVYAAARQMQRLHDARGCAARSTA